MKRLVCLFTLLLLVLTIWSFGPTVREGNALIRLGLISPPDSTKVTTATPTFTWWDTSANIAKERPRKHHIILARNPNLTSIVWEDSTIAGSARSKVYPSDAYPLTEWSVYYWTVKVQVDSIRGPGDTVTFWQVGEGEVPSPFAFFYTKATLFHIRADGSGDLPTIQEGIAWAAPNDTVLVEPGTYYENLRVHKSKMLVTSGNLFKQGSIDTTVINKTTIDGNHLTLGKERGSVVFFSSAVDSSFTLRGFTIRGGKGTKKEIGGVKKICGGGIFCDQGSSPTIMYNVITGNQVEDDGGGIFIYWAAPNILHNIITRNSAKGSGGGIECAYSIQVPAPKSSSSEDGGGGEDQKTTPLEEPRSFDAAKTSPPSLEPRLKTKQEDIKNSLNPPDATEVAPAAVPLSPAQSTQNNPPVAVCQDDSIYGDTLVGRFIPGPHPLDARSSYDPDSAEGDYVKEFLWEPAGRIILGKEGYKSLPFFVTTDPTKAYQTFTNAFAGLFKFRLRVKDSRGAISQNYDSVLISVQFPALADAGKDTLLLPGTRAYLNGSGLEINPDQRNFLKYFWKAESVPVAITILPSDTVRSINFAIPSGLNASGTYKMELRVYDGYALSDRDQVYVYANRPPNARVSPWKLGSPSEIPHAVDGNEVTLDASLSYDPDSSAFQAPGTTSAGGLKFSWSVVPGGVPPGAETPTIVDATKRIAKFIPYGTGTYKFQVLVNDTISLNRQPPDTANPAKNDTIGNIAFLTVVVDSTYAYPLIYGNLISQNYAGAKGGGIDCNKSSPDIVNNIFYKNQSKFYGGAICARSFSTPQIKNNIFFGNISSDSTGGAIADLKDKLSPSATRGFRKFMAVQTNDFWDNRGGTLYNTSGNISDNIYSFPRLIDPDFGDFRLECSSPCVPKGMGSLVYFQPCGTADNLKKVWLSLFQNPVATAVAHFLVNTDAPLKAPPVAYVTMGDRPPSPVSFVPISSKSFRGGYVFSVPGTAKISIFASSVLEKDTLAIHTFEVQLIGAGKVGKLTSSDHKVGLLFPEGAVKEDLYATCISVSGDPKYQFEEKSEILAFGEAYQLSPSIFFEKDLTVSFLLSDSEIEEKDKSLFSVYKYEEGRWNQQESYLDGNSVCAKVKSLGVYRLGYDPRGKHITGIPKSFELFQNYPNPFNPETQIRYDLPVSGQVRLTIYNVLGQKVKVLVDELQEAGYKSVIWDGKDDSGREVASAIYFYKIEAPRFEKAKKMVLLK